MTPVAQRDLSQIWDVTEGRRGVGQAENCTAEIRAAIERVAADPGRGWACGVLRHVVREQCRDDSDGGDRLATSG